jgi:hypothetical protein
MGLGGQRHALAALPPGKIRYTRHRRLGGPQERSGRVWKISPPNGIRSSDFPAHRRRYTDCAIPAHETSLLPVAFKPTVPASERQQTPAIERAATGTGAFSVLWVVNIYWIRGNASRDLSYTVCLEIWFNLKNQVDSVEDIRVVVIFLNLSFLTV